MEDLCCYVCIARHLERSALCPTCKTPVRREQLFPNYALNAVLEKVKAHSLSVSLPPHQQLENALASNSLSLSDVNSLLSVLLTRKREMESETKYEEIELLLEFLYMTKQQTDSLRLNGSYDILEEDIKKLELQKAVSISAHSPDVYALSHVAQAFPRPTVGDKRTHDIMISSSLKPSTDRDQLQRKKRRIAEHIDELQQTYIKMLKRKKHKLKIEQQQKSNSDALLSCDERDERSAKSGAAIAKNQTDTGATSCSILNLEDFGRQLQRLVRHEGYQVIATLQNQEATRNGASLVSSVDFDKEGEHFAVAGYNKRIRVYDYRSVVQSSTTAHFPVHDISTPSRLSCVSWNGYIRSQLSGSEFSGRISVWDLNTSHEHEKRVWSVHFAPTHPTRIISASDDAKVKLWSTNQRLSAGTIEVKANVCAVKFHPESPHYLAFGAADHRIYYYDARTLREPLLVLVGHEKAVSHIQFLDNQHLVSASIDGTLRVWDLNTSTSVRSLSSHVNKRLFVGLSVHDGEWITTGSEDSRVYTYHKDFKSPLYQYSFEDHLTNASNTINSNDGDFVSALCYHKTENVILAAHSRGVIKALQLR